MFQQKTVGIIKIQIHGNACGHEYVVDIDQDGQARGYVLIDFLMKFPSPTTDEHVQTGKLYLKDVFDTFGEFALLNLLHAFLFKYKIFIIVKVTDNPKFITRLNALFSSYIPRELPLENLASPIERKKYKYFAVVGTEYLILDMHGRIINTPWGERKKFDFEIDIIKKLLRSLTPIPKDCSFKKKLQILTPSGLYLNPAR